MVYSPFGENGKISVSAPAPYPPLEVEEPNPHYARLLGIDMASPKSELTSITQYIYQSWTLPASFDHAGELMRRIAAVEMHHLDMLGTLISKLGGNPRFQSVQTRPLPWDGRMVTYNQTPALAIRDNMVMEQNAINNYRKQTTMIRDPHVVAVIRRIIMDEEMHMLIFKRLLAEINMEPGNQNGKS